MSRLNRQVRASNRHRNYFSPLVKLQKNSLNQIVVFRTLYYYKYDLLYYNSENNSIGDLQYLESNIHSYGIYCQPHSTTGKCVTLTFSTEKNQLNLKELQNISTTHSITISLETKIRIQTLVASLFTANNSVVAMVDLNNQIGIVREYNRNLEEERKFQVDYVSQIKIAPSFDQLQYYVVYVRFQQVYIMSIDMNFNVVKEASAVSLNDQIFSNIEMTKLSNDLLIVQYVANNQEIYFNVFSSDLEKQGVTHQVYTSESQDIVTHKIAEFENGDVHSFWSRRQYGIQQKKLEFDLQLPEVFEGVQSGRYSDSNFQISNDIELELWEAQQNEVISYKLWITNQDGQTLSDSFTFENLGSGQMIEGVLTFTSSYSQIINALQILEINPNNYNTAINIIHEVQICGVTSTVSIPYSYEPPQESTASSPQESTASSETNSQPLDQPQLLDQSSISDQASSIDSSTWIFYLIAGIASGIIFLGLVLFLIHRIIIKCRRKRRRVSESIKQKTLQVNNNLNSAQTDRAHSDRALKTTRASKTKDRMKTKHHIQEPQQIEKSKDVLDTDRIF